MRLLKNFEIGTQMLFVVIIAFIGFIVIGRIYLSNALYQEELRAEQAEELIFQKKIAETQYLFLDARRLEKGFLLLFNEDSVSAHEDIVSQIKGNFHILHQINENEPEVPLNINIVKTAFTTYTDQFNKIVHMWRIIGLSKEDGLLGTLRGSAHDLEDRLNEINEPDLTILMLMMRRHEKDFLMRQDKKYINNMALSMKTFLNDLSASSFTISDQKEISVLLKTYHDDFMALADLRLQILAEVENLNQLFAKTLPAFDTLITQAENRYQSFVAAVQYNSFHAIKVKGLIITIITLISLSLAILIGRGITHPIKRMANVMTRLADGELDIKIPIINSKNEIGAFAEAMQVFKTKLIAKKHLTEVTEKERAARELELEQARDAAEAGERAKTAFISNMSHEIRTPMNAIIGFSEIILQNKGLEPETLKQVGIINNSAKSLLSLINDILDLTKLESNKLSLEKVDFNLYNMLGNTLQLLEHQAVEKGLEINSEYADQLPHIFIGDPHRLRQILLNLVGNAIKFTETGHVTITVQPYKTTGLLHFSITDTGIGMTEKHVAMVFERFSQADESTTRRFGGTGLGTAISKQLVELMDGRVWVESELSKGSTFHFTVNLTESLEIDHCLYNAAEIPLVEYISPRKFRILLAEDVKVNAELVITRLEQQGHTVVWVKNGRESVKEVRNHDYNVVLMDVMMPELDGLEATIEIRRIEKHNDKHLPIIALTASVTTEDKNKCLAKGMDTVVAKPIDFNNLLATMENLVPEGHGQLNTHNSRTVETTHQFNFSLLKGKINYTQALENWRNPAAYASALTAFGIGRLDDAVKIKHLLASSSNLESARMIIHSLKGVAGNLGIVIIANLASGIEKDLYSKQIENVLINLDVLHNTLQETTAAIEALDFPNDSPRIMKTFDAAVVRELLIKLFCALDELDPDVATPHLDTLAEYLVEADLVNIRKQLKTFNFDNAQAETNTLALKLNLNIDRELQ